MSLIVVIDLSKENKTDIKQPTKMACFMHKMMKLRKYYCNWFSIIFNVLQQSEWSLNAV